MITATATLGGAISATAQIVSTQTGSCADASWTLEDEDSNVLDSGTIPSGGYKPILAPNGSISINGTFVGEVLSNGSLPLTVNLDGSPSGSWDGDSWEVTSACPSVSVALDDDTPYFNQEITITATVTNPPAGTLYYRFIAANSDGGYTISNSTSNSTTWNVTLTGTVVITCEVYNVSGAVAYNSTVITIDGLILKVKPWKTVSGTVSNRDQFQVPTRNGATYNVSLVNFINEDGTLDGTATNITTWNDASWLHTFSTEETLKYVQIIGTFELMIDDDIDKVNDVIQWDNAKLYYSSSVHQYLGVENVTASDAPDLSNIVNARRMFNYYFGQLITDNWDFSTSTATDFSEMSNSFSGYDGALGLGFLSTIAPTNLFRALRYCGDRDYNLRSIDYSNVTSMGEIIHSSTMTTVEDAEATLVKILADNPTPQAVGLGGSVIRAGSAGETAYNTLVGLGFTFTFGGII